MKFQRILRAENNLGHCCMHTFSPDPCPCGLDKFQIQKSQSGTISYFSGPESQEQETRISFNLTKKIHSKFWFNSCFCHFLSLQNKSRLGYIIYRLTLCHLLGDLWVHGTCRNMNTGRQMSGKSLCVCVEYESCYKEVDGGNKGCRAVY